MMPFDEQDDDDASDAFFGEGFEGYEDSLNEMMVQQGQFSCSFCGEPNDTFIDPSQGAEQEYVEDCQTCCAPNLLRLSWQEGSGSWLMVSMEE